VNDPDDCRKQIDYFLKEYYKHYTDPRPIKALIDYLAVEESKFLCDFFKRYFCKDFMFDFPTLWF
jgi:hypothetical protein